MVTWALVAAAPEWLTWSIDALERGNWRLALQLCGADVVATEAGLVELAAILSTTAIGISSLGIGDVAAAIPQFSAAAKMLPPIFKRPGADDHVLASVPPRASSDQPVLSLLTWGAARILWREQSFVSELLSWLRENHRPRDCLVEAYSLRMGEVEFSPDFWDRQTRPAGALQVQEPDPLITRKDLLRRASWLRKLVLPETGDVSQSVWHDIGGPVGLRAAALSRLGRRSRPLGPETKHPSDPIPIRLGHLRAWECARQWRIDVGRAQSDRQ
jgi:hypothetical protein